MQMYAQAGASTLGAAYVAPGLINSKIKPQKCKKKAKNAK